MDRVETSYYHYILFDTEPFGEMLCLIVGLIKDRGSIPFIFIHENEEMKSCCDTLSMKPMVEEIKSSIKYLS
jgi:hypothetical protein